MTMKSLAIAAACVVLAQTSFSEDRSYFFRGSDGGDWNAAKNWIPNGVPGEGDSVFISNGVVKCSGTAAVKDLKIYVRVKTADWEWAKAYPDSFR